MVPAMRRRRNGTTGQNDVLPGKGRGTQIGSPRLVCEHARIPRPNPARANSWEDHGRPLEDGGIDVEGPVVAPQLPKIQAPRHQWYGPKHGLEPSTKHTCRKLRFLLEKKQVTIQRFAPMFVISLPSCNAMPLPLNRSIAAEPRPIKQPGLASWFYPTWESVMTCVCVCACACLLSCLLTGTLLRSKSSIAPVDDTANPCFSSHAHT